MSVTSTISPIQVGSGQGKKTLYTATKVTGPFGSPPKYETEIIRYDNAKGEGGKTIGTRSSDNPGKIEWNANASRLDKQNQKKIGQASAGQVKSIKNEVADNAQKKEALDKASGNGNKAEAGDDATNDAKAKKDANNIIGSALKDIESVGGTREDKFGVYVFPTTLRSGSQGQDFLKFDMMKYEPKEIVGAMEKGSLGLSDRKKDRKSIGTVILPIPGGIQDQQQVQWGSDSMDAAAIALSDIALSTITEGLGAGVDATINAAKNISKSDEVKTALATAIAGSASGAGNLLTRTTGAIMNPNMELLFNSPSLRSFNFSFTLAPRNKAEAMTVIKIIRFFKQGMAPIRSESNLFLKSPHTFQMQYLHRGSRDHKFLNKFKECALQSLGVNYTPNNNYSVYEDGSMQAYQMNMTFTEIEPVFNDEFPSDGDSSIGF